MAGSAGPSGSTRNDRTYLRDGRRIFHMPNPQNVPPACNERGEMLLSSRVDTEFREGYERYRNAFERKRREKMESQKKKQSFDLGTFWPFQKAASSTPPESRGKTL